MASRKQKNVGRKRSPFFDPGVSVDKCDWDSNPDRALGFLQLCVLELEKGNIPEKHLTAQGYSNIIQGLWEKFRIYHDKSQMKNRWDYLRKMWSSWQFVKNSRSISGVGWNDATGTIDASADWWRGVIEVNPRVKAFMHKGLDHEELMDRLFSRTTASRGYAWLPHKNAHEQNGDSDEGSGDSDEVLANPELVSQQPSTIPAPSKHPYNSTMNMSSTGSGSSGKRKRTSGAELMSTAMQSIAMSLQSRFEALSGSQKTQISGDGQEVTNETAIESKLRRCTNMLAQFPGVRMGDHYHTTAMVVLCNEMHQNVFLIYEDDIVAAKMWLDQMVRMQQFNSGGGSFSFDFTNAPYYPQPPSSGANE